MLDDVRPIQKNPQTDKPLDGSVLPKAGKAIGPVPIASVFNTVPGADSGPAPIVNGKPVPDGKSNNFWKLRWSMNHLQTFIFVGTAIILIGGAVAATALSRPPQIGGVHLSKRPPKPAPKITTVPNTLTGLQVDASVNQRPVTGVMVENSADARPQSGLDQAGVVFEAIAEGGVTRFLALFQDTQPDYIGPVRSARPYYVQWCMGFDCALAHAGGSPEALQNIRDWGTKDLNDTPGIFWRINSRYSPHNLYTSTAKLNELESGRGYATPTFTGFARKSDQPFKSATPAKDARVKSAPETRTAANGIDFAISSGIYNAHFDYDAKTNGYHRSQGGAPHMTVNSAGAQAQISPKVVIGIVTSYGIAADKHSQYGVIGSGQAYIFQDGTVATGTWSKTDITGPLKFTDATGKDIPLNAGQTWVTALAAANLISYQ